MGTTKSRTTFEILGRVSVYLTGMYTIKSSDAKETYYATKEGKPVLDVKEAALFDTIGEATALITDHCLSAAGYDVVGIDLNTSETYDLEAESEDGFDQVVRLNSESVDDEYDECTLAEGDVVRLNSGGPLMTVTEIDDCDDEVVCSWFDEDDNLETHSFHWQALTVEES